MGPRPQVPQTTPDVWVGPTPISGLYRGESAGTLIDLRIDVDERHENSPVLNRISGDLYTRVPTTLNPPFGWRYVASWRSEEVEQELIGSSLSFSGAVTWSSVTGLMLTLPSRVSVTIASQRSVISTPLAATLHFEPDVANLSLLCRKQADWFREIHLEIDACRSVDAEPELPPAYDTAGLMRPDVPPRRLTMPDAYAEAGVQVDIESMRQIIDDSSSPNHVWTKAELNDALETHFSEARVGQPVWSLWLLIANGTFGTTGLVMGVMFDGPGLDAAPPYRQGLAVFRAQPEFTALSSVEPPTSAEAEAQRAYLFTWVHEMGHAFGLGHYTNNRHGWMYPIFSDYFLTAAATFAFEPEELLHIRHGFREQVIFGDLDWITGPQLLTAAAGGSDAALELRIEPKRLYDFFEPVYVEVALRNISTTDIEITSASLQPEDGAVTFFLQRPDGRIQRYQPIVCQLRDNESLALTPGQEINAEVFLGFGKQGFFCSEPGTYRIYATYESGDFTVTSAVQRFRVAHPRGRRQEELATDFFTRDVGTVLYVDGSSSPYLDKANEVIDLVIEDDRKSAAADRLSMIRAHAIGSNFSRIVNHALVQTHRADPERAITMTTRAAKHLAPRSKNAKPSIAFARLEQARATWSRDLR
jgi:hypothetical protein